MRKYAQILDDKVSWVFDSETIPVFHESITIIDITDLEQKPLVGWGYAHGKFSEINNTDGEIDLQPSQEEIQLQTLLNTEFLVIMSEINGQ